MRRALLSAFLLACAVGASGSPNEKGYIDYTIKVTGARVLKTHVRAPLSCSVLTQFGLRDENGRLFGFQFDGQTPCSDSAWTAERWTYDHDSVTEVYIGVSGEEHVPGLGKAQFTNNAKAHTTVVLRPDATGTVAFDNLQNRNQEFVSGTIQFRVAR